MKTIFFTLLIILSRYSIAQDPQYCSTTEIPLPLLAGSSDCGIYQNYSPQNLLTTPIKTLRIAIHIMQKSDGSGNFQNIPYHMSFINEVESQANFHYEILGVANMGTSIHISDSRIRLYFERIYFHLNTSDYMAANASADYTKYVTSDFDGYGLLTTSQILELRAIAMSKSPIAANAQAVLDFIDGQSEYNPAFIIEEVTTPRMEEKIIKGKTESEIKLHCFPNPSESSVNIEIMGLTEAALGDLFVIDVAGKIIQSFKIKDEYQTISIAGLSPGMYHVILSQQGTIVSSEKIIILK